MENTRGVRRSLITLCGTPQVTDNIDGTPVSSPLAGRRVQVLTARLVLERERGGLTPGQLATTIWGDDWPNTWASALRGLISKARRSLNTLHSRTSLKFNGELYRLVLDRSVAVDVEEALNLLKYVQCQADALSKDLGQLNSLLSFGDGASPMVRALEVLGKPFLPDVDGEWVNLVRHKLQTAHLELAQLAAQYTLETGHDSMALEFSSMAVAADSLSDRSMRLRLRALIAAGNRARAIDEYIRFRDHLNDELGIAPEDETQHIYLSALGTRTGAPKNPRRQSRAAVMQYGVTDQLNQARRCWQDTVRGRGGHLRVRGEPGSGKSTFIQALLREFGAQAEHVIVCNAWEVLEDRSVLAHALASYHRLSSQCLESRSVSRNETVADLVRYLQNVGVEEPVLLLIDDLDRSDEITRRTLTALMASQRWPHRLMVVSTEGIEDFLDADPPHSLLPQAAPWSRTVTLRRLRPDEIQKFLADLGQPDLLPGQVNRIYELSGGNPLLASLISTSPDEGDVDSVAHAHLRYRTRTLGSDDLAVLEATALCGPIVESSVLAAVLSIQMPAVLSSLATLKRLHLLTDVPLPDALPDTQAVRFSHGVYGEAILASVSPTTAERIARKLTRAVFHDDVGTPRLYARKILKGMSVAHLQNCPKMCPQSILECLKEAIAAGDRLEVEELCHSVVGLLPNFDEATALSLRLKLARALVPLDTAAARDLLLDTAGAAIRTNDLPRAMESVQVIEECFQQHPADFPSPGPILDVISHSWRGHEEDAGCLQAARFTASVLRHKSLEVPKQALEAALHALSERLQLMSTNPLNALHRAVIAEDLWVVAAHSGFSDAIELALRHGLSAGAILNDHEIVQRFEERLRSTAETLPEVRAIQSEYDTVRIFCQGEWRPPLDQRYCLRQGLVALWALGDRGLFTHSLVFNIKIQYSAAESALVHQLQGRLSDGREQFRFLVASLPDSVSDAGFHDLGALAVASSEAEDPDSMDMLIDKLMPYAALGCGEGYRTSWGPVSYHLGRLSLRLGRLEEAADYLNFASSAAFQMRQPLWVGHAMRETAKLLAYRSAPGAAAAARELRREAARLCVKQCQLLESTPTSHHRMA